MKKRILFPVYIFFLCVIAGAWMYQKRAHLIGLALEPVIEESLSRFFNMKVQVRGLYVDLTTGELSCARFTIMNPREFTRNPHIDVHHLKTKFNVRDLLEQRILIDEIELGRLDYTIERILFEGDTRTNCRVMSWNIKDYRKAHAHPASSEAQEKPWRIEIKKILIRDGSFYYRNLVTKEEDDLQFNPLHGHLLDFRFPSDEKILNQDVELAGMFGREHSVPFWIRGKANFATSNVWFDLKGHIDEGPIQEYRRMWSGMGLKVKEGRYTLDISGRYKDDYFDSTSRLVLQSLKVTPGKTVVRKIWGSPMVAVVKFLESQETIELQIPVYGDITDPSFEFSRAFRGAFQSAIKTHTRNGLSMIREAPSKIASGATLASEKIMAGVGAVTDVVTATTSELKDQVLTPITETKKV